MNADNHDGAVNWEQITDLIGDEADASQHEVLVEMWRDMRADVRSEWLRLETVNDEAELKHSLHRLRGVVSMWGLGELAASIEVIEKSASPLAEWRRSGGGLGALRDRSMGVITGRFPWLGGSRI